jgi:flagellar biosynthesis/type III secretory pathway chaperone
MKLLLENWQNHLISLQEQLLIEGRIEDVKKKYPRLEPIIDFLVRRDPSGNQKYLAWGAKQAEVARLARAQSVPPGSGLDVAQLESSWAPELTDNIQKFHKWNQRLPKFGFSKDLNSYKDYEALRDAINKLDDEETQAQKRGEEKKAAFSEAHVIDDTEDYFIIRPTTTESSCFFGKGTRWCISADQSNNYFNSYTSEGKMFYFMFMKHVDPSNKYKKLAFVLDNEYDLESVFDAEDSELDSGEIEEAFIQNILNQATAEGAWMTYLWAEGDRHADEATKEDIALYLEALERLDIFHRTLVDVEDQFSRTNEEIREKAMEVQSDIMEQMRDHAYQNPAGPTEADYQKIQDEFDESAEHSYIMFDEYEDGKYYYNGGMSFEFSDMEWIDEHEDNDDVIEELVREAADNNYIYIDEIEVYSEEARLDFNPDYDESGVDGFKAMADRVLEYDSNWQATYDEVIEKFKEKRLIPAPDMEREREYWPSEEEKAKQIELPGIMSESKKTKLIIEIKKRK